ncbi:hypothetical protein EZV62_027305 [Acer yangbiense]|uniref:MADS-box domain-containing protein n=1 Tax=Acer yangbiense TaxID=1000413 RepID=A0A5C7GTD0_9ROSI|nr:hypothetical protein EZV62_027305 [Acer yangbiense]
MRLFLVFKSFENPLHREEERNWKMIRKKVTIKRLDNMKARQAKYSKRKKGIIKKAKEVSVLCDVDLALVMFSPSGKPSLYVGQDKDLHSVVERLSRMSVGDREERSSSSRSSISRCIPPDSPVKVTLGGSNLMETFPLRLIYVTKMSVDSFESPSVRRVDHGNGRSKPSSVRHTSKSFGSDRGHLSYVEITNEGGRYTKRGDLVKEESRKIIKWKARKEDVEWAEFSVIGVLKCLKSIEDHKDFFLHRFLWDDVLDFVEDHSNWSIYASISKWVRLSGFPIRIWCPSFFNAVRNSFGLTLHIEDRAALKGRLDSYRILVAMAENQECPSSVLIEAGSESFRVDVKEVDEAPSDEWIGEKLGLFPNSWNPNRSGKVKSPVKKVTSGKLVIFKNQNRGRVSFDACGVVADGTIGKDERDPLGCQTNEGAAKRKASLASFEKVYPRSRDGASSVVVGKEIIMSESFSESSLSSGEEGIRFGPLRVEDGSVAPSRL